MPDEELLLDGGTVLQVISPPGPWLQLKPRKPAGAIRMDDIRRIKLRGPRRTREADRAGGVPGVSLRRQQGREARAGRSRRVGRQRLSHVKRRELRPRAVPRWLAARRGVCRFLVSRGDTQE